MELVERKYSNYVKGYKLENSELKKIQAYIIEADQNSIGYIQIYNARDFERENKLVNLPTNLAAIDFFLGESEYLNNGNGLFILNTFLENFVNKEFKHILVDPDCKNIAAIKTYEKAGFKVVLKNNENYLMMKNI